MPTVKSLAANARLAKPIFSGAPARPKAVVFRSERREIVSAVIVILGPAALRRQGLRLLKLTAAKNVPRREAKERAGALSLILWRRRLIVSRHAPDFNR